MTENPVTGTLDPDHARRPASAARLTASTLLGAALLAFLFPFATVSCGEPVTFTGLELATARVASDAPTSDEREFGDEIESNGTTLALIALVAIALGLGLALVELRGAGAAALVGLLALLLLPWSAAASMADFAVHGGYVLATGALTVLVGLRRIQAVSRRSREHRRRWPAVLAGIPLVALVGVTVLLCVGSARSFDEGQLLSSSSSGTSRITRAGLPTTTFRGGTSFVTTAPAPTNASSPTSTPGQRIAPPPTRAPRRIVGPRMSSRRLSVRPMKLSFVVTTQGATKTSSSSVEYAVT